MTVPASKLATQTASLAEGDVQRGRIAHDLAEPGRLCDPRRGGVEPPDGRVRIEWVRSGNPDRAVANRERCRDDSDARVRGRTDGRRREPRHRLPAADEPYGAAVDGEIVDATTVVPTAHELVRRQIDLEEVAPRPDPDAVGACSHRVRTCGKVLRDLRSPELTAGPRVEPDDVVVASGHHPHVSARLDEIGRGEPEPERLDDAQFLRVDLRDRPFACVRGPDELLSDCYAARRGTDRDHLDNTIPVRIDDCQ